VLSVDRMFAPPPDVPHAELFAKLCAMPRAGETVPFPRVDFTKCPLHAASYPSAEEREAPGCQCAPIGSVHLRVLTQDEQEEAKADALTHAKTRMGKHVPSKDETTDSFDDLFTMYLNVELLFRACRNAQDRRAPFFRTPQDVEKLLYVDEIGVLVNAYIRVQNTYGPFVATMEQDALDAILDRLEEGGRSHPLDFASLGLLKALLTRSVRRSSSLRTGTSSPGTQPVEPTPETSPESPSP